MFKVHSATKKNKFSIIQITSTSKNMKNKISTGANKGYTKNIIDKNTHIYSCFFFDKRNKFKINKNP